MTIRVLPALAALLTATAPAVDAIAECHPSQWWSGDTVRDLQVVSAGDRLLVRSGRRNLILDPAGQVIGDRVEDPSVIETVFVVGGDTGFFEITTAQPKVTVTRLDLDGAPLGEPIVLNEEAPFLMGTARAAYSNGVLAVTWRVQQARSSEAWDLHVALLRPDGTELAKHVIAGRVRTRGPVPVGQGAVTWILWSELPDVELDAELEGVRFSTGDGARLDDEPISIAQGDMRFLVATPDTRVRLYLWDMSMVVHVLDLAEDGAVAARGIFSGQIGRQPIGLPSGEVFHLDWSYYDALFPGPGPATITRETADGAPEPVIELDSVEIAALPENDQLVVVSADDQAQGRQGTSRLMMRRFTTTGQLLTETLLFENTLELVDDEICDDEGCNSVGSGRSRTGLAPLLLVAGFLARRRRPRR